MRKSIKVLAYVESEVNKFLLIISQEDFIDVRITSSPKEHAPKDYTAMVIFRQNPSMVYSDTE